MVRLQGKDKEASSLYQPRQFRSYLCISIILIVALCAFYTSTASTSYDQMMDSFATTPGSKLASTNFQLAFNESFGFFDDIPDETWRKMKAITKGRVHHMHEKFQMGTDAARFYQKSWDPDFSCLLQDSIGQAEADGHKWICDPSRLVSKDDCLVYSIGSNNDFTFETDLHRLLPNCEIHIFDPADYSKGMESNGLNGSNFHAWALDSKNTIPVSMERLGHTGRRIDIFKIDCEGCEYQAYPDIVKQDIRQVLMEVHGLRDETDKIFQAFYDEGYVIFQKEPNLYAGGNCLEFSFLKLAKSYFQ